MPVERVVRLVVENLHPEGRTVAFGLADAWASGAAGSALETEVDQLRGELQVRRAADRAEEEEIPIPFARGQVEVAITAVAGGPRACDRCADPVSLVVEVETGLAYVPTPMPAVAGEAAKPPPGDADDEIDAGELDLGWYSDGEIDLAVVLREALALSMPPRVLCADLSACDARTEQLLRAASSHVAGPFSALKGIELGRSRSN